jgi:hypothetical protein
MVTSKSQYGSFLIDTPEYLHLLTPRELRRAHDT